MEIFILAETSVLCFENQFFCVVPHPFPSISCKNTCHFSIRNIVFLINIIIWQFGDFFLPTQHPDALRMDLVFHIPGFSKKKNDSYKCYCSTWTQVIKWPGCFPLITAGKFCFFWFHSVQFFTWSHICMETQRAVTPQSSAAPPSSGVHITACVAYGSAYHVNNHVWIMQFLAVIIFYYYQGSFLGSSSFHLVWNFGLPY